MKLVTLRKRREFLRVRGGGRCSTHAFVLEGKGRIINPVARTTPYFTETDEPRIGFTVTKRLGNAVKRNRIRRRLKAALTEVANAAAKDHFDYVLIARAPAQDMAFPELVALLEKAFERIHKPRQKPAKPRRRMPQDRAAKPNAEPHRPSEPPTRQK